MGAFTFCPKPPFNLNLMSSHPIIKDYNITLTSNNYDVNAYRTVSNTTPEECAKVCISDNKCLGFWFKGFPGQRDQCELKDKLSLLKNHGVGVFYTRLNMDSAWPTLTGYEEPQNQKMPMMSGNVARNNISSLKSCESDCNESTECTAFYYNDTEMMCELKKFKPGAPLVNTPRARSVLYVKKNLK
jgi:hypothetical protein